MAQGTVSRRTVVASGAAVMGGLAFTAVTPQALAQGVGPRPGMLPAEGVVGLWTRFDSDQGATFRLAQLDASMQPAHEIGFATLPAERISSVAQLHQAARGFAVAAAARSWGVAVSECHVDGRTIRHPGSGRCVRYLGWTDFV